MTLETQSAIVLVSYTTPVAAWLRNGCKYVRSAERYSVTTSKHINGWLRTCATIPIVECGVVPQAEIAALLNGGASKSDTEEAMDLMTQYFPTAMNGGAAARKLCPQCGGNGCFTCSRRSLEAYNHPIMREPSDCEWEEPR